MPGQVDYKDRFWRLTTSQGNYRHFCKILILAGEKQKKGTVNLYNYYV